MPVPVLPVSTQKILDGARRKVPVHPGLELTKFVAWSETNRGRQFQPLRPETFQNVLTSLGRASDLATKWRERRAGWLMAIGDRALRLEIETVSPCVLWLAAPTALELGFCLHHTYGLPYLPGSALKGVARRQCLWENEAADSRPDAETLGLFGQGGDTGHAGRIDFLDGIPLDPTCLELDVMNPHHPDYYSGRNRIPHDCEGPIPLTFLRIRVGARFEVAIVAGPKGEAADLARARELLLAALTDLGLGAKTSSGYGLFAIPASLGGESDDKQMSPEGQGPGPREVIAVVKSFDANEVVFTTADGTELRFARKDLDGRFQMTQQRWNQYRKSGQKLRLVAKNGRVDSLKLVKS